MTFDAARRRALLTVATLPLLPACTTLITTPAVTGRFEALEKDLGGRLGVAAMDCASGKVIAYRADERFAMCSTFKMMAGSAILARSVGDPGLLNRRIGFTAADLVTYSPVTEKRVDSGMTLEELCASTIIVSDNAAANLILRELGGPEGLTRFARSIGDHAFRLDRYETALNSAIEGDPRDTTTPRAMMQSLRKLVVGEALPEAQRRKLTDWLVACETGGQTIRAGVPASWTVGNKTGSGGFGSRNDVGVLWPPGRAPIAVAIYTVQRSQDSTARNDIVAAAARVVAESI